MYREKVRSIGISLLGGNSGSSGKYELGIDSIRIVNDEDVVRSPSKSTHILSIVCGMTFQFQVKNLTTP